MKKSAKTKMGSAAGKAWSSQRPDYGKKNHEHMEKRGAMKGGRKKC